ncbi:nuclear transport factor 2 family protein [Actinomadura luteofluorescens]|uniref:nuclear transport factor 2 family protein n=1 Tax=Actinomadura luteofluorescens TaxID=46163 RepID=UPI00363F530B
MLVHDTGDPEVIVAEFGYDGRVTASGRAFRVANIQVLRVRDGLIAETRDYHDHPGFARALRDG